MLKQRSSLISRDAALTAPAAQDEVARYVSAKQNHGPTGQQRRRLSDKLEKLVDEAKRVGDAATVTQVRGVLAGALRRSRNHIGPDRRAPEVPDGAAEQ